MYLCLYLSFIYISAFLRNCTIVQKDDYCALSLLQLSFCYFNCTLLPHFHVNIKSNQPQFLSFFHIHTGYVSHVQQTM